MPAKKSGPGIAWLAFDHEGRCFNVFHLKARSAAEAKAELIDRGYFRDLTVRRQTTKDTMGPNAGYRPCACRDCFETAIGGPGSYCHTCAKAGCDDYQGLERMSQECQAPSAYGGDDDDGPEPRGPRPTGKPHAIRTTTKRFKRDEERFIATIERTLEHYGGQRSAGHHGYRWTIPTKAGILLVQPDPGTVFARFLDPAAAARLMHVTGKFNNHTGLNIISGKWNHHYTADMIRDGIAADDFARELNRII
jgi:hypothetical protein